MQTSPTEPALISKGCNSHTLQLPPTTTHTNCDPNKPIIASHCDSYSNCTYTPQLTSTTPNTYYTSHTERNFYSLRLKHIATTIYHNSNTLQLTRIATPTHSVFL